MLNRREFIGISGAALGAAALGASLLTEWSPAAWASPETDGEQIIPSLCEMCFWKCGVLAHVKGGELSKIEGNPAHPLSRGRLCPRGVGGTGLLNDPDRLRQPLIRREKGGQQSFEVVSWESALDLVAEQLLKVKARYGPEAVALFSHGIDGIWLKRLLRAFGTQNLASPSYAQCRGAREVGFSLTFGAPVGSPEILDMSNSRVITLLGCHLGENMHNTQVQELAQALSQGAELIVVDPRFSIAAGKAKHWLPIKPGTDLALLLAWMHILIKEKRYDADYVAQYTTGFEALRDHIQEKTPAWAAQQTGLSVEQILKSARLMAGARPATLIHPGRRTAWYGDDTQRSRAIALLNALLGSWGRRGGFYQPQRLKIAKPQLSKPPKAKAPAGPKFPFGKKALAHQLRDASLPGDSEARIHAWMVYGTNLIQALPQPERSIKALENLDFMVAIDVLPAEITGWADVILPECSYLERYGELHAPKHRRGYVALRQPVVPPLYESRPGWWIAKGLGERLSLASLFPWTDAKAYLQERVERSGLSWEVLLKKGVILGEEAPSFIEEGGVPAFRTPSGKIELYSQQMADAGLDPLPQFKPPDPPPEGHLRLLFGRAPVHTFGRSINNPELAELYPENEVWVNAQRARILGFTPGERIYLINQDGVRTGPVRLKATQRIREDCVFMVHGYGQDARGLRRGHQRGGSDARLITQVGIDPAMGGTGMNRNFVRLEKIT